MDLMCLTVFLTTCAAAEEMQKSGRQAFSGFSAWDCTLTLRLIASCVLEIAAVGGGRWDFPFCCASTVG